MPVWKLSQIDPYQAGKVSRPPHGREVSELPWLDPALCSVEQIEDSRWPADGLAEVLDDPHNKPERSG